MIQRQQTLWLLLSAICALVSYKLSFFSGSQTVGVNTGKAVFLTASSTFFLMVITGASILLSLVTLFLFKDRKLQLRLCFVGIGLAVLLIVIYFAEMRKLSGSISLWAVFVFAILGGYIMAARGIYRDEKLVKTLDKLR